MAVISVIISPFGIFDPSVVIVRWYSSFTEKMSGFRSRNVIPVTQRTKKVIRETTNIGVFKGSSKMKQLTRKMANEPMVNIPYKAAKP